MQNFPVAVSLDPLASYLLYGMKRIALAAKVLNLLFSQSLISAGIYLSLNDEMVLILKCFLLLVVFEQHKTDKY